MYLFNRIICTNIYIPKPLSSQPVYTLSIMDWIDSPIYRTNVNEALFLWVKRVERDILSPEELGKNTLQTFRVRLRVATSLLIKLKIPKEMQNFALDTVLLQFRNTYPYYREQYVLENLPF